MLGGKRMVAQLKFRGTAPPTWSRPVAKVANFDGWDRNHERRL
jgi:hypothetical protein